MNVEILNIDYILTSKYNLKFNECAICFEGLESKCTGCQENLEFDKKCFVILGECQHSLHLHCWENYINNKEDSEKNKCPFCRSEYIFKVLEDGIDIEKLKNIIHNYN